MSAVVYKSVSDLRAALSETRRGGKKVGVVLTMGALHRGHQSLILEAARLAEEVVVTIFVNPTQFGPGEDFERYPRDLERDVVLAESTGATAVFAPTVLEMYPSGEETRVSLSRISQGLCGAGRPGHFDGVATVVTKLMNAVGPGAYFFGKKDYQQFRLIERLAKDLLLPVEVIGVPTVREEDGLALSSRNAYLSESERKIATSIPRGLQAALTSFRRGERSVDALTRAVESELGGLQIEYVEIRKASSLEAVPPTLDETQVVLALAARLGKTRLIDNIVLEPGAPDITPRSPGADS